MAARPQRPTRTPRLAVVPAATAALLRPVYSKAAPMA
jgi:hypothetical protein